MSSLTIDTTITTDDSVNFDATYTSPTRIVFTLSVNGSGRYFIGVPFGVITNDTGAAFSSFYALLVGAPVGTTFGATGYELNAFPNGTTLSPPFPNATQVTFSGPPGIGAGDMT